jgi:hypothetical protein
MLPDTQNSKAINAMQQRLDDNRLKLLELDVAIGKTKDALRKAQSEIEAKKEARHIQNIHKK